MATCQLDLQRRCRKGCDGMHRSQHQLAFGTGPVKGFAVTLIMGIIASMITAVFVTRTFFMIWLNRRPALSTLSI